MNNNLVIIRGCPGSGKSTKALTYRGYRHFEADMFFEAEGYYMFDASRLAEAHEWCLYQVKKALLAGDNVVVSNTFTRLSEFAPYVWFAEEIGAEVTLVECTGNYQNIHNVPEHVVQAMRDRWETIDLS